MKIKEFETLSQFETTHKHVNQDRHDLRMDFLREMLGRTGSADEKFCYVPLLLDWKDKPNAQDDMMHWLTVQGQEAGDAPVFDTAGVVFFKHFSVAMQFMITFKGEYV